MENVGLTFAQVSSKARREGVGLHMADSHTGNHPEGGFTPFKTIRSFLVVIRRRSHSGFEGEAFKPTRRDTIVVQRCGLSAKELNEFLSSYPIPSEYDVIFPTSTQTIFDAPLYFKVHISRLNLFGCAKLTTFIIMCKAYGCEPSVDLFRAGLKPSWEFGQQRPCYHCGRQGNFIYTEDDDDLALLPKEPSPGFGIGSPYASVNTEPPKDVEEPEFQPAEVTADLGESPKAGVFVVHPGSVAARIKERKCKTRGGSSRPHVKRKLASGSLSSCVVRAQTSASKDDAPFLSISNDDEGLPDCFEIKDDNACHLKISAITLPAWISHLDNQIDLELLDLHDRCYAQQAVVDNAVNKRAPRERSREEECEGLRAKCEAAMVDFDQNPAVLALREKISSLSAKVKEHK
ncbi:hypothetical protein Tco_0164644, partial [Tanacetum coccineum]